MPTFLCPAMPCYALLCPAMPCYALPCPAMPCHALLCMSCYAAPSLLCHETVIPSAGGGGKLQSCLSLHSGRQRFMVPAWQGGGSAFRLLTVFAGSAPDDTAELPFPNCYSDEAYKTTMVITSCCAARDLSCDFTTKPAPGSGFCCS